jgi:HSP20 family protein
MEVEGMYRDIFDEIDRMHAEMDRLFFRAYPGMDRHLIGQEKRGHRDAQMIAGDNPRMQMARPYRQPVCNVQETESEIIATFELPGVEKGDIDLNVERDHISVKVEQKQEKKKEDKEKGSYSYMSSSRSFQRYLPLPKEVDASSARAKYENGVLRVEMPKLKIESSSKRLQIE